MNKLVCRGARRCCSVHLDTLSPDLDQEAISDDFVLVGFASHVGRQNHVIKHEVVDTQAGKNVPPAMSFKKDTEGHTEIGASPIY